MSGSADRFRHRKARKNLKVDEEDHARLVSLSKGKKLPMNEIVGFLVDLCLKYSFLDEGWEGRLQASLDRVDEDADRQRPRDCIALAWTQKDGYVCCLKAPRQQKLGNGGVEDMEEICGAHGRVRVLFEELDDLREMAKTAHSLRLPQCRRGSRVRETPKGIEMFCPLQGGWRPVEFCVKTKCQSLTHSMVTVKGELGNAEEAR